MLAGLEGVVCLMDDVLVFAQDVKEHDARLDAVLRRIQSSVHFARDKLSCS